MVQVSFRTRLLLALLGCVALLLGLTMAVVRLETDRQVERFEAQATDRASLAFEQLEQLWQDQLGGAGMRLNSSPRIQAALAESDPTLLAEVTADELVLAAVPDALAVFGDLNGDPVVTLLDGTPREAGEPIDLDPWIDRLLDAETRVFGYEVVDGRLFVAHAMVVTLFQRPLGMLLLGVPLGDDEALRLGQVLEAEICFVVDTRCAAATPGARTPALERLLVDAAGRTAPTTRSWERARWALIPQRLGRGPDLAAARVIAMPLEPVLAPFDRIRRVASLAGIAAVVLAGVLASVLSRGLTRPVERLVDATRRIARGEYEVRVAVPVRDEIGALGEAFNHMAEGLALKERYRGVLDKVVSPEVAEELLRDEIRLGGETREVTTLFADIRGFTSRTEGMPPQEVIGLLNEYLARATAAVEAEHGVVDKYVGDEVIALFGAPVARHDDPLRAVRAALAIQAGIRELNAERAGRGEPPLELGVGINTGEAVAGNMGSARRMNYTVVGEAVNLTARLCSAAGAGEILISDATYTRVRDHVRARRLPAIRVKGLSYEVQVYAVEAGAPEAAQAGGVGALAGTVAVVVALLVGALAHPAAAGAQNPPGSGAAAATAAAAEAVSPATRAAPAMRAAVPPAHFGIAGRLELEGYLPRDGPAWIIEETDPFVAGRFSLFGLAHFGERVSALVEARADRGQVPGEATLEARLQQALVHVAIGTPLGLGAQAGKFVSPFGAFPQRHRTPADPFIRPPLAHEHRTIVSSRVAPGAIDGFLDWKDEGTPRRRQGAPLVWAVPYPTGVMVQARTPRLDARAAVLNSAPSSPPARWAPDLNRAPEASWVAGFEVQPIPELRLGASFGDGPYLEPLVEGELPPDADRSDFRQRIWNFSVAAARGLVDAHAELFLNRWQVPNLPADPRDVAFYTEARLRLGAGAFLAARYSGIHFDQMARASGDAEPWDHDASRWQIAAGYRLTRASELRAEYALNRSDAPGEPSRDLFALQLWWTF